MTLWTCGWSVQCLYWMLLTVRPEMFSIWAPADSYGRYFNLLLSILYLWKYQFWCQIGRVPIGASLYRGYKWVGWCNFCKMYTLDSGDPGDQWAIFSEDRKKNLSLFMEVKMLPHSWNWWPGYICMPQKRWCQPIGVLTILASFSIQ